jgi:tRNA/tmRNA/rRNA uracil-C5-methylase (TrmA/RlmC/RlmD family)
MLNKLKNNNFFEFENSKYLFAINFRIALLTQTHSCLQAFFQVNTKAAEVLYSTVGEVAELDKNTTLLDVCCGCGTIGLCLADKVKQVNLVGARNILG